MIIDKSNAYLLNTKEGISFHDDEIGDDFYFNSDKRELVITIDKCGGMSKEILDFVYKREDRKCKLRFNNVIGFSVTSANFWGKSSTISGVRFVDEKESALLSSLISFNEEHHFFYKNELSVGKEYIEISIQLNTLDKIVIVCESFAIE